jgi:hypothetical protein
MGGLSKLLIEDWFKGFVEETLISDSPRDYFVFFINKKQLLHLIV